MTTGRTFDRYPLRVQIEGERIYSDGLFEVVEAEESKMHIEFKEGSGARVTLTYEADGAYGICTCREFSRMRYCAHFWVLARIAEERKKTPEDWRALVESPPASVTDDRHQWIYALHVGRLLETGRFDVTMARRKRKKNGQWGTPQSRSVSPYALDGKIAGVDRAIFGILLASHEMWNGYGESYGSVRVPADVIGVVLPMMAGSGRLFGTRDPSLSAMQPLRWDGGEAWEALYTIEGDALHGWLRRGD